MGKCNWDLDVIDIRTAGDHTLILTSNLEVYGCGNQRFGQLGFTTDRLVLSPQKIEGLSNIIRIECGAYNSACIDNDGNLFTFGYNRNGHLGLGDTESRYTPTKNPFLSNIVDIPHLMGTSLVKTSDNEI